MNTQFSPSHATKAIYEELKKVYALRSPKEKCKHLDLVISTFSLRDLADVLPNIINNIFDPTQDWGFRSVLSYSENSVKHTINAFFRPTGHLLLSILQIDLIGNWNYQYPFASLPEAVRKSVLQGRIPQFYQGKLHVVSLDKLSDYILLTPFDYFIFSLFNYIASSSSQLNNYWQDPNCFFVELFQEYLNFFLPPFHGSQNVDVRNLFFLLNGKNNGNSPHIRSSQFKYNDSELTLIQRYSLSFIEIFAHMVLCQEATEDPLLQRDIYPLVYSQDHLRIVRNFIKHVHYFTNSFYDKSVHQRSTHLVSISQNAVEDLYKTALDDYIVKPFYNLLIRTLHTWSANWSYRLLLETWLSFIQPWRYASPSVDIERRAANPKFVFAYLPFYTQVFIEFLPHFLRIDLTQNRNVDMLYRLTKVYSENNLKEFIKESEDILLKSNDSPTSHLKSSHFNNLTSNVSLSFSSSYNMPTLSTSFASQYKPSSSLFAEKNIRTIGKLLEVISVAISRTEDDQGDSNTFTWSSFVAIFTKSRDQNVCPPCNNGDMLTDYTQDNITILSHLKTSADMLRHFFSIPAVVLSSLTTESKTFNYFPECEDKDNSKSEELFQLLNGDRRVNVLYRGDPVLQPIRSYENEYLTNRLYQISCKINKKYCTEMQKFFNNSSPLVEYVAHKILYEPVDKDLDCRKDSLRNLANVDTFSFQPRVSLRFLGDYRTHTYLFAWMYLVYLYFPVTFLFLIVSIFGLFLFYWKFIE